MSLANAPSSSGVVAVGLHKSFGAVHAVRGVDLSIPAGQTVALLGPNGAGKSTTIDMLLGLNKPDAGSVSLFGMSPADAVRAGAIGVMLQSGAVIRDVSVRELVAVMASLYPDPSPVDEVLQLAGVETIADRRTNKLSGGETQRVRFAVAMVSNPDLLVLDEPTVAMDVEGRRDFWATMRTVTGRGKTVLFATHYLDEADAHADRIVLLAGGRVVADGATTEIKSLVGRRVISATLVEPDLAALEAMTGVDSVEQRGATVTLSCNDSDQALRELLARFPAAHDIEVRGAGLEEAFLALTADDGQTSDGPTSNGRAGDGPTADGRQHDGVVEEAR
ncbi:MAG TPA: ABC transporter ATP-binding protein [Acidimicrobiales bacterium]|jgi:ABC-2 type transport system ATP-binding protein|nr:ABC transporter ATP-binding protein [Acidimicrobiales bacterium]